MARPTKQGIDYFPLDCQFDDKTEMFLIENGSEGLATLITLWQMIYSNEGYYIENGKDLCLLIKRRINVDENRVNSYINSLIARNIFDKCIHKRYKILTSKAIQKRFFEGARRKKIVRLIKEFLLIDVNSYNNLINVDINSINVVNNATKEEVKEEEEVYNTSYNVFVDKNPAIEKILQVFFDTLPEDSSYLPKTDAKKLKWAKCAKWAINKLGKHGEEKLIDIIQYFRDPNNTQNGEFNWADNFRSLLKLQTTNKDGIYYLEYFWDYLNNREELEYDNKK